MLDIGFRNTNRHVVSQVEALAWCIKGLKRQQVKLSPSNMYVILHPFRNQAQRNLKSNLFVSNSD